jgi:DNA-binding transcriptional MerR regulator
VADLRTQIESARGAGYSDDEIASFLSQRDPRVQQAIGAGYSAAEVLQFLTTQQPAAPAAALTAPAALEMRIAPEVQAQRDQGRLQILQAEREQIAQQAQTGDQRAVENLQAIDREIARATPRGVAAPRQAPSAQPAAQPTPQPQLGVPEPMQAAAEMPRPTAQPAAQPQPQQPQERGLADQLGRQLGLTGRMAAEGVAGGLGLITDPIAAVINQFVPPERRLKTLRSVVSTLLTEGGIAQPETPVERVVQEAGQAVAGAAPQIAAARQVPRLAALATAPGAQLAGAAGAGGGAQTAAEMGAGPGAQIAAGLAGGAAAGIGAGMQRVPGQTAQDIEAARQARIRLMTSDVRPPQTVVGEAAERVREAIPITGTTPVRTAQQRERVAAVNQLMQEYGYPTLLDDLPEQITKDLIAKRGADLTRLTGAKSSVINSVAPNAAVPVSRTTQAVRDEIAKLSSATGAPEIDRVINDLTELGTRLQTRDLQGLEIERQLLRDRYADPALANVKAVGDAAINRIYSALVGDMGDFIKANGRPNDYNKWRSSSTELGEMVRELNSASLKAVLRRGDVTPEVVQNALFSNKPSEVKLIVKNLSPQGRDLAKAAVLRRIGERASSLGERGAADVIDPTKFAQEAKDLGSTIGVVFTPQEAKRIESLVRVLNLTRRAQDVRAPVQLMGSQIPVQVPQFLGAATVGAPAMTYLSNLLGNPFLGGTATLGAGLTIGALGRFYESAPMRNLLDRLATTKPGSAAEAQLVTALSALRVPQPEPQP